MQCVYELLGGGQHSAQCAAPSRCSICALRPPWTQGSFAPHMPAGSVFGLPPPAAAQPGGRAQDAFVDSVDNSIEAALARAEEIEAASPHRGVAARAPDWKPGQLPWVPLHANDAGGGGGGGGGGRPEDVPLTVVDTAAGVAELLQQLTDIPVFGLDIEQCQTHSHYGHSCTLQFATPEHGERCPC